MIASKLNYNEVLNAVTLVNFITRKTIKFKNTLILMFSPFLMCASFPHKALSLSMIIMLTFTAHTVHAVLSISTANSMKGAKPELLNKDAIAKLSFNNIDESLSIAMPNDEGVLSYMGENNYTYFSSSNSTLQDITPYITYLDPLADFEGSGHQFLEMNGVFGVTYIWRDKSNHVITNLSEHFNECLSPYTLTVLTKISKVPSNLGHSFDDEQDSFLSNSYVIAVKPIDDTVCP